MPPITRVKLIRLLNECGAVFVEEGGEHTIYQNPRTKKKLAVPRHREISPGVVRKLLQGACEDR